MKKKGIAKHFLPSFGEDGSRGISFAHNHTSVFTESKKIPKSHFNNTKYPPRVKMSAFQEIMSQQLIEELNHKNEAQFDFPIVDEPAESPEPSDLDDEQLAREMQETFDAEFAAALASGDPPKDEGSGVSNESEEDFEDLEDYAEFDSMGMPVYHSNRDENGDLITKHNPVLAGMRNANKIGLYVDGAGDMDGTLVANPVYNSLQQKSLHKEKRQKTSVRRTVA